MRLEDQHARLTAAGVQLDPVEALLRVYPREDFERVPYSRLVLLMSRSPHVWNFDLECITGPASYEQIVRSLARVARAEHRVARIAAGGGFVSYELDGRARRVGFVTNGDWADRAAVSAIMADLESPTGRFYNYYKARDTQAMELFFLPPALADEIIAHAGDVLLPAV